MANFSVSNILGGTQQAVTTTPGKTLVAVFCSATVKRGKVYDILVGTNGTPADNAMVWDVSRMTVDGTGTTITPTILDPADAAASMTSKANYTVEPTITANSSVFYVGVNQRASIRWVCAPGSELVWPATAAAGFVLRVSSPAYTGTATGELMVQEQ